MIYGEVIPSTFFQIALNVNHKVDAPKWQRNKSWVGLKTISKITGFNFRTVSRGVKVLIDIDLLHQSYHGKLKTFQLINNDIVDVEDMLKFIESVEDKLLQSIDSEKRDSYREKFLELNEKLGLTSKFHCQQLLKKIWIPDIMSLRESLVKAESIYKGSSLFLINLINQQLSFKKETIVTDNIISEKERSLMIGCSQSTLNRYIKAYEAASLIERESQNGSYSIRFNFNKNDDTKKEEGVVNSKMENNQLVCPLCDRLSKDARSFNLHLTKQKDASHKFLNELRRIKYTSIYEETIELYNQNKPTFDSMVDEEDEESVIETKTFEKVETQKTSNYMSVPCECRISCEECFKDWKSDYFDGCKRPRKEAYTEEFSIGATKQEEKPKRNKKEVKEKVSSFEDIPSVKKQPSEDTAPGLLKFFYDMTEKRSPNWGKESRQIKNLLTSKEQPLTAEQVRIVLKYMARRGYDDVRFLSSSITEALLEHEYLEQINKEGTAAHLLKRFYNGHNMELNLQTFTREVRKVQETINSGLSYEDTKFVIDYMIETGCTTINFIGSKRNDALSSKSLGSAVKTNSKDNNNFKNNPSFFDQDFINIIRDELISGRANLRKVEEAQKESAKVLARQLFVERKFTNRYTSFEWAWRTGLELDNETYELGCKELERVTYLDSVINSGKLNEDQLNTYKKLKTKFEAWLQQQHDVFRNSNWISNNS
jgi:hypothetical protein